MKMETINDNKTELEEKIIALARMADEKKAQDVQALDLQGIHSYLNYFLIMTANSSLHAKSLARDIKDKLHELGIQTHGHVDNQSPDWIVFDCFWLVIHIFQEDSRQFYALDKLWADAGKIAWS